MAVAIHVPRINNNDDEVKLVEYFLPIGAAVKQGQAVAAVETDKAVVDVEAPADGYLIRTQAESGTTVTVGTVLAWLGATPDEPAPTAQSESADGGASSQTSLPTAKARALMRKHGIQSSDLRLPQGATRITAEDVESHLAQRQGSSRSSPAAAPRNAEAEPQIPGTRKPLRSDQKGMLATVTWHRDHAVPGYIEIAYDGAPWDAFAAAFQRQHGLLLNPLLPLLTWRLVEQAHAKPELNATVVADSRHEYSAVNVGFTVQAGEVLYLAVTRNAHSLGQLNFVHALIDLQRRAAAHKLSGDETQGATIGFSSMARWKVARHIPVLAPMTALMVAHTQDHQGQSVLGATYDHRVLHGADVAALLRRMTLAPATGESA
jgi:pyruvate/2-oxoglutarate dehydrogenase complex dihydrolipoamide acyltransferase (E2) component